MDYFSDLLSSYEKLKKRKLKIRLSEESESGGSESKDSAPQDQQMMQPQTALMSSPYAAIYGDKIANAIKAFEDMQFQAEAFINALTFKKEGVLTQHFAAGNLPIDFLVGPNPASIEMQIANAMTLISDPLTNAYIGLQPAVPATTIVRVSENIANLVQIVGSRGLREKSEDLKIICRMFKRVSDGSVLVCETDSADEGLIFRDPMGFFKEILSQIEQAGIGLTFEVLDYNMRGISTDNILRGVGLEHIQPILNAQRVAVKSQSPAYASYAKLLTMKYKEKVAQAVANAQMWVNTHMTMGAVDVESAFIIDQMNAIFLDPTKVILNSIIKTSRQALRVKKPDFAFSLLNNETKKSDEVNAWLSFEEATAALKRLGYQDDEIQQKGMIVPYLLNLLTVAEPEAMAAAQSIGLTGNEPVYLNRVISKNFINPDKDNIVGVLPETKEFLLRKDPFFTQSLMKATGLLQDQVNKANNYFNGLVNLTNSLFKFSGNIVDINSEETNTRENPRTICFRMIKAKMDKDFSYQDKMDNSPESRLYNTLTRVLNVPILDKEESNYILKMVANYTCSMKLMVDLKKGLSDAKYYLISKLFLVAGNMDNGTSTDFRDINAKKTSSYRYNDVIEEVAKDISYGFNLWSMAYLNGTITIYKNDNKNINLTLTNQRSKEVTLDEEGINIPVYESVVKFSPALTQTFASATPIMGAHMVETYLNQQRVMFETLLKVNA